jgi:hypothetical protein
LEAVSSGCPIKGLEERLKFVYRKFLAGGSCGMFVVEEDLNV